MSRTAYLIFFGNVTVHFRPPGNVTVKVFVSPSATVVCSGLAGMRPGFPSAVHAAPANADARNLRMKPGVSLFNSACAVNSWAMDTPLPASFRMARPEPTT